MRQAYAALAAVCTVFFFATGASAVVIIPGGIIESLLACYRESSSAVPTCGIVCPEGQICVLKQIGVTQLAAVSPCAVSPRPVGCAA